MHRRTWLIAALLVCGGCSAKKATKNAPKTRPSVGRSKRPKGPKTMGNLLVDAYVDDLKKGTPEKKIFAAQELAAMGSNAKGALPTLESVAADKNAKVSTAAKNAIKAIKK